MSGSLSWTTRGEPSRSISHRSYKGSLVLFYAFTARDREPEQIEDQIQVEWTPCNYGGHRPWFRCSSCNRRVMVLARQGRLFRRWKCHHLPYGSQTEMRADRLIRKERFEPFWAHLTNLRSRFDESLRRCTGKHLVGGLERVGLFLQKLIVVSPGFSLAMGIRYMGCENAWFVERINALEWEQLLAWHSLHLPDCA